MSWADIATRPGQYRWLTALGVALGTALLGAGPATAAPGTERVSVRSGGAQADGGSSNPAISASGRFVAFSSVAADLVPVDPNGAADVFVHDRRSDRTRIVSVRSNGTRGNDQSGHPTISADGRFVAFASDATNLVPKDSNGASDVFVHDRRTGRTMRVSVRSNGAQGNGDSSFPAISGNGRYVAFQSDASNLVRNDTNGARDVFVHDRSTGRTVRVSVRSNGTQGNGDSSWPSISGDGRLVAFDSGATNLVANDTNAGFDAFVHDRGTGRTRRVSLRSNGAQGDGESGVPAISGDGRFVAFNSTSTNLVSNDTNGVDDVFVHDRDTGRTRRVSVTSGGAQGDAGSYLAGSPMAVSGNGRFVAFESEATDLVANDTNSRFDVFVHDLKSGKTRRASVSSNGSQGDGGSIDPSMSADGRFVAFFSNAEDLVAGDSNGGSDIFVRGPLR